MRLYFISWIAEAEGLHYTMPFVPVACLVNLRQFFYKASFFPYAFIRRYTGGIYGAENSFSR